MANTQAMKRGKLMKDPSAVVGFPALRGWLLRNVDQVTDDFFNSLTSIPQPYPFVLYNDTVITGSQFGGIPSSTTNTNQPTIGINQVFCVKNRLTKPQKVIVITGHHTYNAGIPFGTPTDGGIDSYISNAASALAAALAGTDVVAIYCDSINDDFATDNWGNTLVVNEADNSAVMLGKMMTFLAFDNAGAGDYFAFHGENPDLPTPSVGWTNAAPTPPPVADYDTIVSYIDRLSFAGPDGPNNPPFSPDPTDTYAAAFAAAAFPGGSGGYPDLSSYAVSNGSGSVNIAVIQAYFGI